MSSNLKLFASLLLAIVFVAFFSKPSQAQEIVQPTSAEEVGAVTEVWDTSTYPADGECSGTVDTEVCFDTSLLLASPPDQQVGERFQIWFWRVGNPSSGATYQATIPVGISTWGCSGEQECVISGGFNGSRSSTGNSRALQALVAGEYTFQTVFTLDSGEIYTRTESIVIDEAHVVPSFYIDGDTENWSPGRIITHTMVISSDWRYNATFYYGGGSLSGYAHPVHSEIELSTNQSCQSFNYEGGYWWCQLTIYSGVTTVTVPYLNTSDYSVGFNPVFMLDLEPPAQSLGTNGLTGWYSRGYANTNPCAQSAQAQGAPNWVEGSINALQYSVVRAYGESGYAIGCTIVNSEGELGWFGLASGPEGEEITFTVDSRPVFTCPEHVTRTSAQIGVVKADVGFACTSVTLTQIFLPLAQNQGVVR